MKNNPFNLTFGKEPPHMISRYAQSNEIVETFMSKTPSQQIYMVSGVRGSGKTVFMTTIVKTLSSSEDWIVIELNSAGDLLKEFASKLYHAKGQKASFHAAGINLSFLGLGLNIEKTEPIMDLEIAIEQMMDCIKKEKKRVLITIDEVSNSKEMRYFAGAFQILIRHDYPLFLLITGLYENINKLQNEDNLTFLYRAPKMVLNALNLYRMADSYENLLHISKEKAIHMARNTKGYSFAFQLFGYFTYNNQGHYEEALPDIRQYLDEYVYDKIWIELTAKEIELLSAMAELNITDAKTIKKSLQMKPNQFSVYRDRLIKKGILSGNKRGFLEYTLPFFNDYIKEHSFSTTEDLG